MNLFPLSNDSFPFAETLILYLFNVICIPFITAFANKSKKEHAALVILCDLIVIITVSIAEPIFGSTLTEFLQGLTSFLFDSVFNISSAVSGFALLEIVIYLFAFLLFLAAILLSAAFFYDVLINILTSGFLISQSSMYLYSTYINKSVPYTGSLVLILIMGSIYDIFIYFFHKRFSSDLEAELESGEFSIEHPAFLFSTSFMLMLLIDLFVYTRLL